MIPEAITVLARKQRPELGLDPTKYRQTDVGLAEMFRDRCRGTLRYVTELKQWHVYLCGRWAADPDAAMRTMIETVRALYAAAAGIEDPEAREKVAKFAIKSENAARLAAALKIAQSLDGIATRARDLDRDSMLLNVLNGTLDLRTGVLGPHDPDHLITKQAPVEFDPNASAPTFSAFLERVLPGEELRTLVQRAVGYSLTGEVGEQVLIFLLGTGANGKSTLANTVEDLFGDYMRPGAPDLLLAKHGESHPAELAALRAARAVVCSEVEEGRHFAESRLKLLTGGETILARGLFQDFIEITPTWTIWLLANAKPRVRGGGPALWRRLILIPFDVVIPEGERDPKLRSKLREELPGILNWAVQGCLDWQKHGLGRPEEVRSAVEEYQRDADNVGRFLEEACNRAPDAWTPSDALHASYKAWCEAGGEFWREKQAFAERLKASGLLPEKRQGVRGWRGARPLGNRTLEVEPDGHRGHRDRLFPAPFSRGDT